VNSIPYLDWGVARAFGLVGGFRIRNEDTGDDVTAAVRAEWRDGPEAFDRVMASAELLLQRSILDGPAPEEEEALRAYGYNPRGAIEIAQRRVDQEVDYQVARRSQNEYFRRQRIRDVVSARELLIELNELLWTGLHSRGVAHEDVFPSPEVSRPAFDSMPSFDVAVSMKTAYHRDLNHRWTVNDISDIDALGLTVPYCDIVVTDKAAAATANAAGLARRFDTVILGRLTDLVEYL